MLCINPCVIDCSQMSWIDRAVALANLMYGCIYKCPSYFSLCTASGLPLEGGGRNRSGYPEKPWCILWQLKNGRAASRLHALGTPGCWLLAIVYQERSQFRITTNLACFLPKVEGSLFSILPRASLLQKAEKHRYWGPEEWFWLLG